MLRHHYERRLPSGAPQLLVNLHEDALRTYEVPHEGDPTPAAARCLRGVALSGVYDRPIVIDTACQRAVIGVSLTPTGAGALLGRAHPSAEAVARAHVDLGDLWGTDGAVLRERLLHHGSPQDQLAALEHALVERVARHEVDRTEMARMQRALDELDGKTTLGAVCRRLGTSERSLRRHVKRWVGIGPKRLARLRRFGRVLTAIERRAPDATVDWARLATDVGCFDQAHLIGEFKSFSGMTPRAYRLGRPSSRHHVAL